MKLTQFRIDPEGPGPKSFKTGRTAIEALLLTSLDSAHCTVIHLTLKNYAGYHLVTVLTIWMSGPHRIANQPQSL